ncbi:MAG: hypothetical protein ABSE49_26495 [Polyangiaceae bacterium]
MWGFTVDDALISVRYAHHVVSGVGWRFNAEGPSTDGVTPLPWVPLLAPLARGDALSALAAAKSLGLVAWVATGSALGAAMGGMERAPAWARAAALATLALSVPAAAYAVSGMETAVATSLATAAVLLRRRALLAAVVAGGAAAFRPELGLWAFVLAVGLALAARSRPALVLGASLLAVAPFLACTLARTLAWGHPAPLALLAKPSDLAHGVAYAGAACVVTLVPMLVLAPLALRRAPAALAVVAAGIAHVVALVAVGGDWMPYARLMVPVLPSLAWAAAVASEHAHPVATGVRSLLALALGGVLVARGGTDGRRVGGDRAALIATARPLLACFRHVASADVGWVGAATDADLVDLGGVTDPTIAVLPGGHTSKRIDARLLLERDTDALLLWAPAGLPEGGTEAWRRATYGHAVDARLAADDVTARHFTATAFLPLGANGAGYVLLRALPPD